MRPTSIIWFGRIYSYIIICAVVTTLWALSNPSKVVPPRTPTELASIMPIMIGTLATISIVIKIILLYFITGRASRTARWIFVVLGILALIGMGNLALNPGIVVTQPWTLYLSLFNTMLLIGCVWLLFRPDSVRWFRRAHTADDLHETFS